MLINDLLEEIASHGNKGAIVPYTRINDLKADMLNLEYEEVHTEWINRMINHITGEGDRFLPSDISFEPQSIITVLIPNSKVILEFNYLGKSIPCIIPPHYSNWNQNNSKVLQIIEDYLAPHGFSVAMAVTLPQKMLAVHSGLAKYGRNNICYCDDYGSHMQMMSYITDLSCVNDIWFPIERMGKCEECIACITSCPTGAIIPNQYLINSDRCITIVNENPENSPNGFPKWISKEAHNSILGCTLCQDCCPYNMHNETKKTFGVTFTEEETMEIINHSDDTSFSDSTNKKLATVGLSQEYTKPMIVSRNLAALLQKEFS